MFNHDFWLSRNFAWLTQRTTKFSDRPIWKLFILCIHPNLSDENGYWIAYMSSVELIYMNMKRTKYWLNFIFIQSSRRRKQFIIFRRCISEFNCNFFSSWWSNFNPSLSSPYHYISSRCGFHCFQSTLTIKWNGHNNQASSHYDLRKILFDGCFRHRARFTIEITSSER